MSSGSVRVLFGKLHGLDEYVAALLALERAVARQPKTLVLDFRRTLKAYPDGMLPLIATLMRLRSEAGFEVRVEPPEDETLHGVFDGVDWTRYLSESSPEFHDLPASTHRFIPVRPFRNASELQRLHENILEVLVRQAPLATNLPEAIWWALSEVMENVLNHAMVGFGWVQASTFPTKRHINILVVDSGIGIRESLAPAFPDLSDIEAIRKAIEEGATRDPDVGAGYGLTGCRRIVGLNGSDGGVLGTCDVYRGDKDHMERRQPGGAATRDLWTDGGDPHRDNRRAAASHRQGG